MNYKNKWFKSLKWFSRFLLISQHCRVPGQNFEQFRNLKDLSFSPFSLSMLFFVSLEINNWNSHCTNSSTRYDKNETGWSLIHGDFPFHLSKVENGLSFSRWGQRGHPGKWQTKAEEKNLSAKVIIREFNNYFLTIQSVCRMPFPFRWSYSVNQYNGTTHKMSDDSWNRNGFSFISYFQNMVDAVYLRIWPRISCGWKNTSHTVTNNST